MTTIKIDVPEHHVFERKWQGEIYHFDMTAASNSYLLKVLDYGLRYFNDRAKEGGDLPSEKAAYVRELVNGFNAGDEWEGRSRGGAATMSPTQRMALKLAKEALKVQFRAATGKAKIVDMCAANDKVAAYFDGTTWLDDVVMDWIAAQAKAGKADYMELAEARIKEEAELAASIDIDF